MSESPQGLTPASGYPPVEFATIFADGVTGLAPSRNIVKMYFAKVDPNFDGISPNQASVVAQLMMPLDAFIQATQFFNNAVSNMILAGVVTAEHVEAVKKTAGGAPSLD